MAKFKFYVSTNIVGSKREGTVEIDDEDLEGLDDNERDELINEAFEDWLRENIYTGWEEV